MSLKRKIFDQVSSIAVKQAIEEDPALKETWDFSFGILPELGIITRRLKLKSQKFCCVCVF